MPRSQMVIDVLNPDVYANGDPERNGLPHDQYEYLRDEAPCFLQRLDDPLLIDQVWVVSRYEDVRTIDRDWETYSSASILTRKFEPFLEEGKPTMAHMDGAEHRRNRRLVSRGFTPPVVHAFEQHLRDLARDIVAKAVAKGTFDFVEEIAVEMPLHAISDFLGVPREDRPQFLKWVSSFSVPTDPTYTPSPEHFMESLRRLWAYGLELAELRRREPDGFLMTKIIEAADNDQLSDDEVMGLTALLASAGADTTRNSLSHALHALMREPEQMAWLRERADDVPATATDEIVRWSTPVIHFCRVVTRAVELHGQPIKKGEKVAMLFASANFDPRAIPDPLTFDLSRSPNPHLSFGMGPHVCIGRHVATLEIKVLLEELLRVTRDIRPAGEIVYARDNFFRGVHSLPVTVVPA